MVEIFILPWSILMSVRSKLHELWITPNACQQGACSSKEILTIWLLVTLIAHFLSSEIFTFGAFNFQKVFISLSSIESGPIYFYLVIRPLRPPSVIVQLVSTFMAYFRTGTVCFSFSTAENFGAYFKVWMAFSKSANLLVI